MIELRLSNSAESAKSVAIQESKPHLKSSISSGIFPENVFQTSTPGCSQLILGFFRWGFQLRNHHPPLRILLIEVREFEDQFVNVYGNRFLFLCPPNEFLGIDAKERGSMDAKGITIRILEGKTCGLTYVYIYIFEIHMLTSIYILYIYIYIQTIDYRCLSAIV